MDRHGQALRLGTRGSRLALAQSEQAARDLEAAGAPAIELVTVRTGGDGDRTPLRELGGVGVFAARLRRALLDREVDLAVHSCKDLPSRPVDGLELICVPRREDPRDGLCARDGLTLTTLPPGARVGTGSPRRAAQLLAARADLEVVDLRGNVPTRLSRVRGLDMGADEPVAPATADARGDLDAVVLAMAGLRRLGLERFATQAMDTDVMLPAPAQGALAIEARAGLLAASGREDLAQAAARLEDAGTRLAITAERALMAALGAGCAAPVGALAQVVGPEAAPGSWGLVLRALVCSADGRRQRRCELRTPLSRAPGAGQDDRAAAEDLGARVASALLDDGAADIVDLRASTPPHMPPRGSA